MLLNEIEYPCVVGTIHGLIKIENINELKHWVHECSSLEIVFIKHGFNEHCKPKFILSRDGLLREFIPKNETRTWAKYISFLVDCSKLECRVINHQALTKEKVRNLFKANITALDMHFPHTMSAYKYLKHGTQNTPLNSEDILQLIEA
jgi:hypothetical protein